MFGVIFSEIFEFQVKFMERLKVDATVILHHDNRAVKLNNAMEITSVYHNQSASGHCS